MQQRGGCLWGIKVDVDLCSVGAQAASVPLELQRCERIDLVADSRRDIETAGLAVAPLYDGNGIVVGIA